MILSLYLYFLLRTPCRPNCFFRQADDAIHNDPSLNHEYLSIGGLAEFTAAAQKLIVGADSSAIHEKRVCPAKMYWK